MAKSKVNKETIQEVVSMNTEEVVENIKAVSYTHLTLPTMLWV